MNTSVESLWPFFVELSLKVTAVFVLGMIATLLLRRSSADFRHRLWMPLLVTVLAAPLVLLLPRWQVVPSLWESFDPLASPPALPGMSESSLSLNPSTGSGFSWYDGGETGVMFGAPESASPASFEAAEFSVSAFVVTHWRALLLALWAGGLVVILLRLLVGTVRLTRLKSPSRSQAATPAMLAEVERLRGEFEFGRPVRVLLSERVRSPFAWGILRPVIALPDSCRQWSDDEMEMILRHEMAHLSRNDGLAALITRLAVAIHWLNPLSWWAARRVTDFREEACDGLVLNAGCDPRRYANLLFQQARSTSAWQPFSATAVAQTGTLERRVKMILNSNLKPSGGANGPELGRRWLLAAVCVVGVAILGIGLSQPGVVDAADREVHKLGINVVRVEHVSDEGIQAGPEELMFDLDGEPVLIANLKKRLRAISKNGSSLQIETQAEMAIEHLVKVVGIAKDAGVKRVSLNSRGDHGAILLGSLIVDENDPEARYITITDAGTSKYPLAESAEGIRQGVTLFLTDEQTGEDVERATVWVDGLGSGNEIDLEEQTSPLFEKLGSITLPSVDFNETPLLDAIEYLQQRSQELDNKTTDPQEKGINIVVKGDEQFLARPVSLQLNNATLGQTLSFVAQLAGASVRVDEHAVVIAEVGGLGRLDFYSPLLSESPGAKERVEEKLKKVVLANIEFNDTPLSAALGFLRQKSSELDVLETDPLLKGINIVLIDSGHGNDARITLRLKNIPLGDALRYTAELAEMIVSVEGSAAVIRNKSSKESAAGSEFGFGGDDFGFDGALGGGGAAAGGSFGYEAVDEEPPAIPGR